MKKTVVERVIDATKKNKRFNSSIARRTFRGKAAKYIYGTVMRTAANLADRGDLIRVSRGEYEL